MVFKEDTQKGGSKIKGGSDPSLNYANMHLEAFVYIRLDGPRRLLKRGDEEIFLRRIPKRGDQK